MTKDDLIAFVQRLRPSSEDFLKISSLLVNSAFTDAGRLATPVENVNLQREEAAAAIRKRVNSERDDEYKKWPTITCPLRTAQSKFLDANIALWTDRESKEEDQWFDACFEPPQEPREHKIVGTNMAIWTSQHAQEQNEWTSACSEKYD